MRRHPTGSDGRRMLLVGSIVGCAAIAAVAGSVAVSAGGPAASSTDLAALVDERTVLAEQGTSRSLERTAAPVDGAVASILATPKSPLPVKPAQVKAVAGLSQAQMNNAATIVQVGRSLHMPKAALIIAVATAMQESDLYNCASEAVPESLKYPHQGTSVDYDSVGIFQQRVSSGWGTVKNLMKPEYQATQFFKKLDRISWEGMSLTRAAQAVQVSAYPDAYAKHEKRATTVVNALL